MRMNILYACNDKYAPYCGVSVTSVLQSNESAEEIHFYILSEKISDENKTRLLHTISSHSGTGIRQIHLIESDEAVSLMKESGLPMYRDSYAAGFRHFFEVLIPDIEGRLLYLDSDTIVINDLSELFTMDMKGKPAASVIDSLGGEYKKLIGFAEHEPYVNSGVILYDCAVWKEKGVLKKLLERSAEDGGAYVNPDQDIYNLVLKNDILILPPKYNFQPCHRAYSDSAYYSCYKSMYYSCTEIEEARRNPVVLHTYRFLGEFPWHSGNLHPDNKLFDEVIRNSEWSDYVKEESGISAIFKIEKQMYRLLPGGMFLRIFRIVMNHTFKKQYRRLSSR